MHQVEQFITDTIRRIVERSRTQAFRSEDQIQGYFEGRAMEVLPKDHVYLPEMRTRTRYVRDDLGHLVVSRNGRPGRIDAVVKGRDGCAVGIEMEYPRGVGRTDPAFFMSHIINDVLKLKNEELSGRYLLIFAYHDPPEGVTSEELASRTYGVHLCYLRLAKRGEPAADGPVLNKVVVPDGWAQV